MDKGRIRMAKHLPRPLIRMAGCPRLLVPPRVTAALKWEPREVLRVLQAWHRVLGLWLTGDVRQRSSQGQEASLLEGMTRRNSQNCRDARDTRITA